MSSVTNFASGKLACAAELAAIDVACGFVPKIVKIYTDGDADTGSEWLECMASGSARRTLGSTGAVTVITSAGITPGDHGFTIGTGCQVASLPLYWIAF